MDIPQLPPKELARDGSHAPVVIGVVSMCLVIATGVLALRLWTRHHIVQKVGWDDYAAMISWLSVLGCGITVALMTRYGLGRHSQTVTLDEHVKLFKCFWCTVLFYGTGHLSFKMAFLFQYYSVLGTPHMRKVYVAAMVVIGIWGGCTFLVAFTFCNPLEGFWDPRVPARCLSQPVLFYVFGGLSITTDVVIFVLPLPALYRLEIPRSQKIYLMGIFSLGFLIVAIAILRLQFLDIGPDFSWANVEPALWSIGELSAAMVCLCLPPLKALGTHLGIVAARTENPKTTPLANRNFQNPGGGLLSPGGPKAFDAGTTNPPRDQPNALGNFAEEIEQFQFQNGVFRQTPLPTITV
ncbi:hypothetical protein LZ30DRAFT_587097 [Colletotrichum cereale]|nr:hypothetical protein LZ30DRAFT_587097 [Colletotrichum cereale]